MARLTQNRSLEPVINAAQEWVRNCLIADNSVLSNGLLWTPENVAEVRRAFVDHPDEGKDDFSTKLKGQMAHASPLAKRLMAEMVWALLLFPSNIKVSTKRQQVGEIWSMSGETLGEGQLPLSDDVLAGIGSGGPGFNNHRWREMVFLIALVGDLKKRPSDERQKLMSEYEAFVDWIAQVPQEGHRQLRHMLRFFCFPDRVERMSSNRERWAVLAGFGVAQEKQIRNWDDHRLDDELLSLRKTLESEYPRMVLDFYEEPLREKWKIEDEEQIQVLAVFVGQASQTNLTYGLQNGIWGFKAAAKPDHFEKLKPGDFIVLGSGYSGGSPRTSFDEWKSETLSHIRFARVTATPFRSVQAEWPDESHLSEGDRYVWRIRFDPESVKTLTNVALNNDSVLTPQFSECLRKSGSANGRGYVLPASSFKALENNDATALKETSVSTPTSELPFDAECVGLFEQALQNAGVVVSRTLVIRMLSSLVSKNLVLLTGLSGSGKTKIAQALARWLPSSSNCFRVVAVGADWTGNENVLGYPNGLEKASYISKPSLDVILHAKANEAIPHFLILDEMNLSHVERYFADILSAIESDEKIHLHQDSERKANGTTIPAEVELPKNLFIIGTVNVDETTYMFSPKVLDRANVIEFRMDAGELEGFLDNPARPDLSKLDGKGASFGKAFVDAAKNPVAVPVDVKPAYDAEMLLLFKTLQAHGAEFGYRTAYETARFIHFYKLLGNHPDGDTAWFPDAFDCVVFQKLLPKLHGSRAKLGPVLKKLWFLCVNDAAGRGADALKAAEEAARSTDKKAEPSIIVPAGAPYPLSAEKIGRMWRLLIENGFASFAEA